jgi:hypothetical protein
MPPTAVQGEPPLESRQTSGSGGTVEPGWLHSLTETSRRRSDFPAERVQTPTSAGIYGCAYGLGFRANWIRSKSHNLHRRRRAAVVGRGRVCTVRASETLGSSLRPEQRIIWGEMREAPLQSPSAPAGAGGSYPSGSNRAQQIRGANAPEPKGLS